MHRGPLRDSLRGIAPVLKKGFSKGLKAVPGVFRCVSSFLRSTVEVAPDVDKFGCYSRHEEACQSQEEGMCNCLQFKRGSDSEL